MQRNFYCITDKNLTFAGNQNKYNSYYVEIYLSQCDQAIYDALSFDSETDSGSDDWDIYCEDPDTGDYYGANYIYSDDGCQVDPCTGEVSCTWIDAWGYTCDINWCTLCEDGYCSICDPDDYCYGCDDDDGDDWCEEDLSSDDSFDDTYDDTYDDSYDDEYYCDDTIEDCYRRLDSSSQIEKDIRSDELPRTNKVTKRS
eukprot:CAMPEP_0116880106 /NCGR_PEP_ID=MMETSP0463-20121206/11988_1 /TAXON_ID=181622 /ORGANISM="Strombidinopsis sp, Strain SopsisLIS2011" /LENGTH=198 /DNA_ID=CAMNT_0004530259 /DNA_START=416 /DNA_END=1012 /DNA_ORIENTATION=+